ncbi:hypothetical protein B6U70_02550 [Euryarchaeota archaeon ex4484_162]|nr:MAG: hypothetical protein B6U70_02550 [Euryarchaeota archaeon ex4484_162]RLF29258.1 MAG: hypothetical protein DRN05_02090 [Thermoplasmata archaeon]RLF36359.1 MAG: hypothetical protein DRN08_01445 [Thermoplasmata archaeon]
MTPGFKKIDAIIVAILIIVAGLFLYRAGYITPVEREESPPSHDTNNNTSPPIIPTPPSSFIPSYRRDVSPEDEGVHYDKIRICREWWYFSAAFDDPDSDLRDWVVAVSFNHMARGDLLGQRKPDLLLVSLFGPNGETYGGIINKKRGFGILYTGTLIASSPGVNVEFEDSWAEGEYPDWHVHAEDKDIDQNHELIVDLDYHANSLPLWTIGNRAFEKSKSTIANYMLMGCTVVGTITVDGIEYNVKGTGYLEHSWTPKTITRGSINGWDWFHITLKNGWSIYLTNFYPTPQLISSRFSKTNPFGTIIITTDNGETLTELRNIDLKITREDKKIFPFVKMPSEFDLYAKPSLHPIYIISQSLLFGTNIKVDAIIEIDNAYNKVWRFPTFVGMKVGRCLINGSISWSDDDGDHEIPLEGFGVSWSMRALL